MGVRTNSVQVDALSTDGSGTALPAVTIDAKGITLGQGTRIIGAASLGQMFIYIELYSWNTDQPFFAPTSGLWKLVACNHIVVIQGTDPGSVTAQIRTVDNGQAIGAGVAQLVAALDLKATGGIIRNPGIIASPTVVGPGMFFGWSFSGVLTNMYSHVTLELERVG